MYLCYLGDMLLPVTPQAIEIKEEGGCTLLDLSAGGQVSLADTSSLCTISFTARLPMVAYPFCVYEGGFKNGIYFAERLRAMKGAAKPLWFRLLRYGKRQSTDIACLIQSLSFTESATEGGDIICRLILRQYATYGTRLVDEGGGRLVPLADSQRPRVNSYTVKKGDTLWTIAKACLGDGAKWQAVYQSNKGAIEAAAVANGKACSLGGQLIYPGTLLNLQGVV